MDSTARQTFIELGDARWSRQGRLALVPLSAATAERVTSTDPALSILPTSATGKAIRRFESQRPVRTVLVAVLDGEVLGSGSLTR